MTHYKMEDFFLKNEKKTIVMVFKIHPVRTDIILAELGRWTLKTHFLHQGLFFTFPPFLPFHVTPRSFFPHFLGEVGAAMAGLQEALGLLSPFTPALATADPFVPRGVLVPGHSTCTCKAPSSLAHRSPGMTSRGGHLQAGTLCKRHPGWNLRIYRI